MIPALTTGLTFARSFPGPVAITAVLGLVLGAGGAGTITWLVSRGIYAHQVAELQVQLAELRERNAATTARRVQQGAEEIAAAERSLRAHAEAITAALARAAPTIRASVDRLAEAQQELSRDPSYDCRRRALPRSYLDGLQLPAE